MVIPSILDSVKAAIGIEVTTTDFDNALIFFINSVFSTLNQFGVGPTTGYVIDSNTNEWVDFLGDRIDLEFVKTYVFLKTKLIFDPPTNSFLVDAITKQISELEFRMSVQVLPTPATP